MKKIYFAIAVISFLVAGAESDTVLSNWIALFVFAWSLHKLGAYSFQQIKNKIKD